MKMLLKFLPNVRTYLMSRRFIYWENLLCEDKTDAATILFHLTLWRLVRSLLGDLRGY